jgi:WS/DGAT/MGAT family acyltransferase
VHHCLVDGVSGIELLLAVLDLVPNPEPTPPPAEPWQPKTPPNPMESWADAMFEQWNMNVRAFTEAQQNLLDPRGQFRAMTEFARAIEVALPAAFRRAAPMRWNKRIGGKRRVAWTEINFQEVRGIRSRLGGTVNDVVLTLLGGALGRYLRAHGTAVDGQSVRLMIPVNVRSENEKGALGNRVSMMLPEVPLGIANPADRLIAVRAEMERLKSQEQANAFETFARLSRNAPAAIHALAGMGGVPTGAANFICTNVPGPLIPLYCVGHRMLAHYPMVPLAADLGIGVGITSYDKALYLGVMADPEIIDDVEEIRRYVSEEFRLLKTLADVPDSNLPDFAAPRNGNGHSANGAGEPRVGDTQPQPVSTT